MRTNVGLGASDSVEFGSFIPPAGTTAEIDAVSTATVGQMMLNTETNKIVRFTSASTHETLYAPDASEVSYVGDVDQGATDFASQPQSWASGGISANDTLGTAAPLSLTEQGTIYKVTIAGKVTPATVTTGGITLTTSSTSASASYRAIKQVSTKLSKLGGTSTFVTDTILGTSDTHVWDWDDATYASVYDTNGATYFYEMELYIEHTDPLSDVVCTFTYQSPALYAAANIVQKLTIEAQP